MFHLLLNLAQSHSGSYCSPGNALTMIIQPLWNSKSDSLCGRACIAWPPGAVSQGKVCGVILDSSLSLTSNIWSNSKFFQSTFEIYLEFNYFSPSHHHLIQVTITSCLDYHNGAPLTSAPNSGPHPPTPCYQPAAKEFHALNRSCRLFLQHPPVTSHLTEKKSTFFVEPSRPCAILALQGYSLSVLISHYFSHLPRTGLPQAREVGGVQNLRRLTPSGSCDSTDNFLKSFFLKLSFPCLCCLDFLQLLWPSL